MTFLQLVQMFLLYSFLGWCSEVIFAAATYGKFINRGFLNGPVCPIYGYGILMVAILLEPISENMPLLFLGSAVLTSAVEFLVGWGSEKLLHVRLWDYRRQPFNLGGYVCLKFSLLWGLACVFIIRLVHPAVYALVCKIPHVPGVILACVFSAIFVADLVVTMIEALKLPRRLRPSTTWRSASARPRTSSARSCPTRRWPSASARRRPAASWRPATGRSWRPCAAAGRS